MNITYFCQGNYGASTKEFVTLKTLSQIGHPIEHPIFFYEKRQKKITFFSGRPNPGLFLHGSVVYPAGHEEFANFFLLTTYNEAAEEKENLVVLLSFPKIPTPPPLVNRPVKDRYRPGGGRWTSPSPAAH